MASPGWYADPARPGWMRWWSGRDWTAYTQPVVPPEQPPVLEHDTAGPAEQPAAPATLYAPEPEPLPEPEEQAPSVRPWDTAAVGPSPRWRRRRRMSKADVRELRGGICLVVLGVLWTIGADALFALLLAPGTAAEDAPFAVMAKWTGYLIVACGAWKAAKAVGLVRARPER